MGYLISRVYCWHTWALMRGGSPPAEPPGAKMVGMSSGVQLPFTIQHLSDAASACLAWTKLTVLDQKIANFGFPQRHYAALNASLKCNTWPHDIAEPAKGVLRSLVIWL